MDQMEERKKKIQEDLANGTLLLPSVPKDDVVKPTVVKPQPPAQIEKQLEDGENLMVPGADQQAEGEEAPAEGEEAPAEEPAPGNTGDDEAAANAAAE